MSDRQRDLLNVYVREGLPPADPDDETEGESTEPDTRSPSQIVSDWIRARHAGGIR